MDNEKEIVEEKELENEDSDVDTDIDEDFEYDDEGNIVISTEEGEDDEEGEEDNAGEESDDDEPEEEEAPEEEPTAPQSENDSEYKQKYEMLAKQAKETLAKLGIKQDDAVAGLEQLAAETDNVPLEEYKKKKLEEARQAEALALLKEKEFEKLIASDLVAIQEAYPVAKKFNSVKEFPNFKKFGEYRDKGLSPADAFAATHTSIITEGVANSVKQQNLNNKNHLISTVPKGAKNNAITMSKSTLNEWRDIFPDLSDKQIVALYKESLKK